MFAIGSETINNVQFGTSNDTTYFMLLTFLLLPNALLPCLNATKKFVVCIVIAIVVLVLRQYLTWIKLIIYAKYVN